MADKRDNLKPFKPGQSGNPGGRPKGSPSVTAVIRRLLEDEETVEKLGKAILSQAARGNGAAMKLVVDRIDGPLPKKVEHHDYLDDLSDEELFALARQTLDAGPPGGSGAGT